ncbi:MAG: peptide ligase PGM1-related protein [Actinomycetota bacterium]|nr:peptide ligase PGM1-related protein [Actinomycetota bacterium]
MVVLPSATFAVDELRKITAIVHYEERMLFTALLLRCPRRRLVYLTSLPVDETIVEYYLRFLPDPVGARRRMHLVSLGDDGPKPLTHKLLDRPDVMGRVRELVDDDGAFVLPFNVTAAEGRLADALDLPFYGAGPHLAFLGSKAGSRQVARRAGVAVPAGSEGHHSLAQVEDAVEAIRDRRPGVQAVVIKLNEGFSGQGNAIVDLNGPVGPLPGSRTTFCAADESWSSYPAKIARDGAVVEELLCHQGTASPSVQMRIAPSGTYEVLSTHDQILGGNANQVYLGCRFPADGAYRLAIQGAARSVAEVLAGEGVIGSFGIDFLVVPGHDEGGLYMSEINLRLGGTTHPYWMARLATDGKYDPSTGELMAGDRPTCYVATDNLKSEHLLGHRPGQVIDAVDRAGLGYDPVARTGATLHLLGAVERFGKMGATCVAGSAQDAEDLYREVLGVITAVGDTPRS